MSTPEDNIAGYNRSTPLWNLENLRLEHSTKFKGNVCLLGNEVRYLKLEGHVARYGHI